MVGVRIKSLDSIRGIASLVVLTSHISGIFPFFDENHDKSDFLFRLYFFSPIHILTAGREAVIIFFVLSGFVISLSLEGSLSSFTSYILRRMCRIILPFAASLVVAATLYKMIYDVPLPAEMSAWGRSIKPTELGFYELLANLALTGLDWHMKLNPVSWSLVHEVRVSLLLPFIMFLCAAKPRLAVIICFAILVFASQCSQDIFLNNSYSVRGSALQTLLYIPAFALGSLMSVYRIAISNWITSLSARAVIYCSAISYVLFYFRWIVSDNEAATLFANCVAAAWIISLAASSESFAKFLDRPILNVLGRISYSLYLSHLAIMFALFVVLGQYVRLEFLAPFIAVICLIMAYCFYWLFERPSIILARHLKADRSPPLRGEAPIAD